jgi:hypothetical protein
MARIKGIAALECDELSLIYGGWIEHIVDHHERYPDGFYIFLYITFRNYRKCSLYPETRLLNTLMARFRAHGVHARTCPKSRRGRQGNA